MNSIRFIHCADLHLDSPYVGMKHLPEAIFKDVKESTFIAYNKIVDTAIEQEVDFVLIVGDLFDQQSTSIRSMIVLKNGLEKLNQHHINAYISFGNHDYGMPLKADLSLPPNTYVFPNEDVTHFIYEKNGVELATIYGFSYLKRTVTERKVTHYKLIDNESRFSIATLHGSLQSNTEHDTYAPFLLKDLQKSPFDYWALGHIHKREIICKDPYAVYPGNIQGRNMKEQGEKGFYLVNMTENETMLNFYDTQNIIFLTEHLNIKKAKATTDLMDEINLYKQKLRQKKKKSFVRLHVYIDEESSIQIDNENKEELMLHLNEYEEDEQYWIWFEDILIHEVVQYDRDQLKQSNQFVSEVIQTIDDNTDLTHYLEDLLNNRLFSKYIKLSDEDQYAIKEEAERLVIRELLKGGNES